MRQYKHHCGATIYEYENGSKVISKYGMTFKSFRHLKLYEKTLDPKIKEGSEINYKREVYRDYRYK